MDIKFDGMEDRIKIISKDTIKDETNIQLRGKIEKEINSVKHKIDPLEQSVESRLKETLHREF